ncbi:MAG: hypothetical protein ACOX8U_00755 [Bradymonadia bacterium]|jgi:hypothetical protein
MLLLVLSILALIVGALAYPIAKRKASWLNFFDALVLLSISGLTLLHLIPHSVEAVGWIAALAALIGFGLPAIFHKHGGASSSRLLEVLALIGLIVHTLLDGMALYMSDLHAVDLHHGATLVHDDAHEHGHVGALLGIGVLLHRLPVGFFITWLLMPLKGKRLTWVVISVMALCTIAGFSMGQLAIPQLGVKGLNVFQALIAGTLLHVVFHNVSHDPATSKKNWAIAAGLGAIVGGLTLVFIEIFYDGHDQGGKSVLDELWSISAQMSPALILGALVVLALFGVNSLRQNKEKSLRLTILFQLVSRRVPHLIDGPMHVWEALSLIVVFALFPLTWALAYLLSSLFLLLVARQILPLPANCECCDRFTQDRCDDDVAARQWLYNTWAQVFVAAILLALSQNIADFASGLKPWLWTSIAVAALGLLFRIPTLWRLIITAILAHYLSLQTAFVFAVTSMLSYDYAIHLVRLLYSTKRFVLYIVYTIAAATLCIMISLSLPAEFWNYSLWTLPAVVKNTLAIIFFAASAFMLVRRGPRALLDAALAKPLPHSHQEPCPASSQESAAAQNS